MIKKACIIILLISVSFLSGCEYRLDKTKNTNLEFWITEEVDSWHLEGYTQRYGMMGGAQFYGTGYVPTYDENNQQIDPEYYVIYTITSYPDHSSKGSAITRIEITDPTIYVYGLTMNSSEEEIKNTMKQEGFTNQEGLTFIKNKVRFRFGNSSIDIDVEVTNKFGIVF